MAHFAKLDENNIVLAVHVLHNNELIDENKQESESKGIVFLVNLHQHPYWKQTSYNGKFRKNYAGIGFTYDAVRDAFIPPKPYNSWVLNEETCLWQAPISLPNDGQRYDWNEETLNWVAIER